VYCHVAFPRAEVLIESFLDHEQAGYEIPRTNPYQPSREDISAGREHQPDETSPQAQREAAFCFCEGANSLTSCNEIDTDNTPKDGAIHQDCSSREPRKNPMVEDFDDSANALWTLYGKEAKGYDEATIKTVKGDMDGVLIFVSLSTSTLLRFGCINGSMYL
jgi:hypothetical protein